jgi:hypothetical protein
VARSTKELYTLQSVNLVGYLRGSTLMNRREIIKRIKPYPIWARPTKFSLFSTKELEEALTVLIDIFGVKETT